MTLRMISDEEAERQDVVADQLAHTGSHPSGAPASASVRDRSSSSVSGASVSRLGRMRSNESMATSTRTSVSSAAFKIDASLPPMPPPRPDDVQQTATILPGKKKRASVLHSTNDTVPNPAGPHFTGKSRSGSQPIKASPNGPSALPVRSGQGSTRSRPVSQAPLTTNAQQDEANILLVSTSTSSGTISQRRQAPGSIGSESHGAPTPLAKGEEDSLDDAGGDDAASNATVSVPRPTPSTLVSNSTPLPIPPPSIPPPSIPTLRMPSTHIQVPMTRRPSHASVVMKTATHDIPMRIRASSQPGKRIALPTFSTTQPPPQPAFPRDLQKRMVGGSSGGLRKPSVSLMSNPTIPINISHHSSSKLKPIPLSLGSSTRRSTTSTHHTPSPYAHADSPIPFVGAPHHHQHAPPSHLPPGELKPYPANAIRRPFHLMRQIRTTILTGAYVSTRLYVPKQMWQQTGVRLQNLETKMKMIEMVDSGLELVASDGASLLTVPQVGNELLGTAERFNRRLEAFEDLLDSLEIGLGKKLGLGAKGDGGNYATDVGKKSGGLGSLFANKLGKGFDRITNNRQ